MIRFASLILAALALAAPASACVGKSLLVGTDGSPRSRAVAHVLAVLINERTGTTVEIRDHDGPEALFKGLTEGDVDLALDYAGRALGRGNIAPPANPAAVMEKAKTYYQETWNLVWLPPLGFAESGNPTSPAAPVAQKHALKKFPALSRLIAKTQDVLTESEISALAAAPNPAQAARDLLRRLKLI